MQNYSCEKKQEKENKNSIKYLWWFHIEHLCDTSLHYEEMRIVHIELNWAEQILHSIILDIGTIDKILILASCHNLKIITNWISAAPVLSTFYLCSQSYLFYGFHWNREVYDSVDQRNVWSNLQKLNTDEDIIPRILYTHTHTHTRTSTHT
jgi:hypothetical protein